jgi:hypothetical protein
MLVKEMEQLRIQLAEKRSLAEYKGLLDSADKERAKLKD